MSPTPRNASVMTMPSDRELMLEREFDAPRDLLWEIWTDPEHLARWWGPTGFSITTHEHDPSEGADWRFTMHGPDGQNYSNHIRYLSLRKPDFLAYEHAETPDAPHPGLRAEVRFGAIEADPLRTRLTFRMIFESGEALRRVVQTYGADEGAIQTFNRLGRHVQNQAGLGAQVSHVITRHFDAPRELVYEAWTRAEHLARWYGPAHAPVGRCSLDLRVGGAFLYELKFEDAPHWGRSAFCEIVPGERLVSVMSFVDEHGGLTRAPFDDAWPLLWLSVVTFEPHAGVSMGSVVRIEWTPLDPTEAERRRFASGLEGIDQGWGSTLDRLSAFLEGLSASTRTPVA
ncbi:MAG: SRPBCC family protein [Phycisphaerales bacterium JB059]